jgi:betaine-aldehyde dehydrogenase
LYYGGAWHRSAGGCDTAVSSSSTGESLGFVVDATASDIDRAVAAARGAFLAWRDTPARERAKAIRDAAAILREHADELAMLDALDAGNPLQAMRYDVEISAAYMDYFAGLVTEIKGARSRSGPTRSTIPCASRWALSPVSAPSTTLCCSSPASAPRRLLLATR